MRLYEMTDEIEALEASLFSYAAEHEGDITDFPLNDALDKLSGEKREKLINIAVYIKNLKAEAKAYGDEKKRLAAKEKALSGKADWLSKYIRENLPEGEKIEDIKASLSWRRSEKLVIENFLNDLPAEFVKTETTAKAAELKAALKAGGEVADMLIERGVHLETCQNLQIK